MQMFFDQAGIYLGARQPKQPFFDIFERAQDALGCLEVTPL